MPVLGVGMVGHAFMGRAHPQAWRNVRAMVAFNYRRVPAVAPARRQVADGSLAFDFEAMNELWFHDRALDGAEAGFRWTPVP